MTLNRQFQGIQNELVRYSEMCLNHLLSFKNGYMQRPNNPRTTTKEKTHERFISDTVLMSRGLRFVFLSLFVIYWIKNCTARSRLLRKTRDMETICSSGFRFRTKTVFLNLIWLRFTYFGHFFVSNHIVLFVYISLSLVCQ